MKLPRPSTINGHAKRNGNEQHTLAMPKRWILKNRDYAAQRPGSAAARPRSRLTVRCNRLLAAAVIKHLASRLI
jgi:hypothetical protein